MGRKRPKKQTKNKRMAKNGDWSTYEIHPDFHRHSDYKMGEKWSGGFFSRLHGSINK